MRNLPTLVREKFKAAQVAGDITYFPTQLAILHCNSLPFQLRYSPALAHKPKSNKPKDTPQKPFDPFLNPPKSLLVANIGSHNLVLNKFPVIPDHFILATKEFEEQTHLLEEADLEAAYDCLKSYHDEGEELFGFFNSGDHSGASQPHRHIQFLPVESMRSGLGQDLKWSPLIDRLTEIPAPELPFIYFAASLSDNIQPSNLHATYLELHQKACQLMKTTCSVNHKCESPISYNLGFTHRSIVLCPRISEGLAIKDDEGHTIGSVALNGTILAGTLLVKSETEWNAIRKDEGILVDVLETIGAPRNTINHIGLQAPSTS
ncbi:bifunctional AP-4-A phosphorylase/ADP sulfurylase [Ciborinia camelliae]|nr:bifunctional AP-4-A phosphorylase/ADP sulfurylase [Ciborinia camelliae]